MRRAFLPLAGLVVLVGLLFLGVFPTRTWLAQREAIGVEQERLRILTEQNATLAARVSQLQTDAEIERLAREEYNLVRPGEQAYAILPSPAQPPPPDQGPSAPPATPRQGWWQRLWKALR